MTKKSLYILTFLALAGILLMPVAMPQCGMNGFHFGLKPIDSFCGRGNDLDHLIYMRNLLVIGLVAAVVVLAIRSTKRLFKSFLARRKALPEKLFHRYFFKSQISLGRLKPFDRLLLAYADGLIQPKTFC